MSSGLALLLACGSGGEQRPVRRVLVTLDTLRLDVFAGGESSPLERTRRWADRGLVFERYYSATSSTQPSHATLFTGLHPWQHGVPRNGVLLAEEHLTPAEQLALEGFRSGAVVSSFPVHSSFGFAQGFDVYSEEFSEGHMKRWNGVERDGAAFPLRGFRSMLIR